MYIGTKQIQSENNGIVTFEDGTSETFSERILEKLKTSDETDASLLRDMKINPLVEEIIALMLEYNTNFDECNYTLDLLKMSIETNFRQAIAKKFDVKHQGYISIRDVDQTLKS